MNRRYSLVAPATAALIAALVVAAAAFGSSSSTKLVGTTGANGAFKITLTKGGHSVKTLAAGSYGFVIHDDSSIHSFALDGPHVALGTPYYVDATLYGPDAANGVIVLRTSRLSGSKGRRP